MSLPARRAGLRGVAAAAMVVAFAAAAPALDPARPEVREIADPDSAEAVGTVLAGPRFRGRGTLQKGNGEAALWLAEQLRAAGFASLAPARIPGVAPGRDPADPLDAYLHRFAVTEAGGATVLGTSANVVGILRGDATASAPSTDDPPHREEFVLLGAHFDHLGVVGSAAMGRPAGAGEVVYPGADDNASGTAAVLLAARTLGRLAARGERTSRSIVVVFFSGEERGLLGSKAWCASPPVPLEDTVAMVNLDMVGRNGPRAMDVYGAGSAAVLEEAHHGALAASGLDVRTPVSGVFARSDHWPFYQRRVPVLFLHSGLHDDYHTPRDTADRVDWTKVARAARHALHVVHSVAADPRRPQFRPVPLQGAGEALGMVLDPASPQEREALGLPVREGAVRVLAVFEGGAGEKLFRAGDVLYRWGAFPLWSDDPVARLRRFVDAARAGEEVPVSVLRGKERLVVGVKVR